MYDVCIGVDESGLEVWADYSWLYSGCIDDTYFNWMYSLWTAQNPDIQRFISDGSPYRKFESNGYEGVLDQKDTVSHFKRFQLIKTDSYLQILMENKPFVV